MALKQYLGDLNMAVKDREVSRRFFWSLTCNFLFNKYTSMLLAALEV